MANNTLAACPACGCPMPRLMPVTANPFGLPEQQLRCTECHHEFPAPAWVPAPGWQAAGFAQRVAAAELGRTAREYTRVLAQLSSGGATREQVHDCYRALTEAALGYAAASGWQSPLSATPSDSLPSE